MIKFVDRNLLSDCEFLLDSKDIKGFLIACNHFERNIKEDTGQVFISNIDIVSMQTINSQKQLELECLDLNLNVTIKH